MVREVQAKLWTFTLNNYTEEEKEVILSLYPQTAKYMVCGYEEGENGTPHIQGFISFVDKKRFQQVKRFIGERAHIEKAKHPKEAAEYCKKDGVFDEKGENPWKTQGKRTDLEEFKDAVKGGDMEKASLMENHSAVWARYPQFCLDYIAQHAPMPEIQMHALTEWQQELYGKLQREPDDRKVIFVVDLAGNKGKTWFSRYYRKLNEKTQVIQPGKRDNMAYTINETSRVIFVDAPRSKQGEYLQYDILEQIKDGMVSSYKYQCTTKWFAERCHVVVMMNEEPDMTKLSADRYDIIYA